MGTIFGILNAAAFNLRTEGDVSFYSSREERDAALDQVRSEAISHGLSESASRAGIYPISLSDADCADYGDVSEWLRLYNDYSERPADQSRMLDDVGL